MIRSGIRSIWVFNAICTWTSGRLVKGMAIVEGPWIEYWYFFVCYCFKYLRASSCLSVHFHLQLTHRMYGSLPPYPWVFVASRLLVKHIGPFVLCYITKGRVFLSRGARHYVIELFGRNYFCQCHLLFLHEIQIEIFWNAVCRTKKLVRTTREDVNVSILHWACVVACVVRVENALIMNCLLF